MFSVTVAARQVRLIEEFSANHDPHKSAETMPTNGQVSARSGAVLTDRLADRLIGWNH
jgi:hypothetical protein